MEQYIKVIINLAILLVATIFSIILISKLKIENKGYKLIFVAYTLFWVPLMLLRENTGTFESKSLGDQTYLWLPMSIYGFVGIFARPLADIINCRFRSRKTFIYIGLAIQFITYIPILFAPCTATNVIQSIGVGIGASCIASFSLLFNEQYGKKTLFLTTSVLSIPSLLADFISSPITSVFRTINGDTFDKDILKYLWLVGLVFVIITFVIFLFVKENKALVFKNEYASEIKTRNEWTYFILVMILGSLIALVKFANSGSIAILHIQKLADLYYQTKSGAYEGYLSVLFSLGQLIGGLLTGLVLVKKVKTIWIYFIGTCVWLFYHILAILIFDPYGYLCVHIFNGLAFGILYNLLIGLTMQKKFKTDKITPIGLYQGVLSIGITISIWFVAWIKGYMNYLSASIVEYRKITVIINTIMISCIILSPVCFGFCQKFKTKIEKNISKF